MSTATRNDGRFEPPTFTDAPLLLLAVVAFSGLLVGWLIAILLGHTLHIPAPHMPEGVLGPIVLSHYSKPQEFWLYILSLFACAVAVSCVIAEWRWFTLQLISAGATVGSAPWIAGVPLAISASYPLLKIPGGSIFIDLTILPVMVALVALLQGALWYAFARRTQRAVVGSAPDLSTMLPDRRILPAFIADASNAGRYGIVLLGGVLFGCYLPFTVPVEMADAFARVWFVWPLAATAAFIALARKRDSNRALYPFLPLPALVTMPLLWASPSARVSLVAIVTLAIAALAFAALRESGRAPAVPRSTVLFLCAVLVGGFLAASVLLQNPTFLHGAYVSPFDGENFYSWMSDGTFGRAPFRDFIWPYGPLMYYSELLFVKWIGLDAYRTAYNAYQLFVATLFSFFIMGFVLRGRVTALLAGASLVVVYGSVQLRVWSGCVTLVMVLLALERRSRVLLTLAGVACFLTVLYTPEIGIASIVTCALCIVWSAFAEGRKQWLRALAFNARWFGCGAALVVIPSCILGIATHSLMRYVIMNVQFFSIADACCATPYPPLFNAAHLAITPGFDVFWLLRDETFRVFYAPPMILSGSIAYLIVRATIRRALTREDIALAAMTVLGIIVFRTALGRSEVGHSFFASLPTIIIAFYLAERALFAGAGSITALMRPIVRSRIAITALVMVQCAVLIMCAYVLPISIFRSSGPLRAYAVSALHHVQVYYTVARGGARAIPAQPGWHAVQSADGETFFFREPNAADMDPVLAFLKSTLGPSDNVCGIPFLSRYQFMIHRPSAAPLGCDTWALGETPQWRRELINQLEETKPRFLLFNDADWPDPDGIPWMDREPDLAAYYFDHYRIIKRIGRTTIYERGEPPPPPSMVETSAVDAAPYLRTGWYETEENVMGRFRWTARTATALLEQVPGQRTFVLDVQIVAPQIVGAPVQTMTVAMQGRPILSVPFPPGIQEVRHFRVPVDPVQRPTPVTVWFAVDNKFAAVTDQRVLGVPILRFGFTGPRSRVAPAAPAATAAPAGSAAASPSPPPAASPAPVATPPIAVSASVPPENVPPGLTRYRQELEGLYAAPPPGCCWITQRNRFIVSVPAKAKHVMLRVSIPPNAYAAGDEGITASFNGGRPQERHKLPVGEQTVTFDVPRAVKPGRNELDLVLDKTFVPAELHINNDTTRYGVLLQRVDFR